MAGRPLSSPESVRNTKQDEELVKDRIRSYLADNIEAMLKDIDELPLKERSQARQKLLDYVMPKVQAVRTNEVSQQSAAEMVLDSEAWDDEM